jgi:Family of unknown function (DUF5678)
MRVDKKKIESDYEWLIMQSLSQYKGQWIAVSDKNIIARDSSLKKVLKIVNSLKIQDTPFYLRVPEGSVTALSIQC